LALNFPDNPTINQIFSDATSGFYFKWDGTVWQSFAPGSSANIQILDDISSQFNGITTSFSLTSGGTSVIPIKSAQLVINLGGIVQDPSDDYFVNGSTISFSEPPETGLSFSGISLGPAIPISNILDGSIFPQDLSTGAPWWLSDYKVGIGTDVPTSLLDVEGDAIIAGILTATNVNVTGIITANSIIAGAVGTSQTSLIVQGNARITGILTVGTGSITLNGSTNNITGISSITDTSNRKLVALASGVKVLYYEATAPVGWTKVTSHNDKCLRVVSGTGGGSGGSVGFTTAFTSRTPSGSVSGSNSGGSVSNTTLTTAQIPSHDHNFNFYTNEWNSGTAGDRCLATNQGAAVYNTLDTGGGGAHNHSFTNPSWSGSFSGSAMNFAVQYIDMILCSFD
jgi:hypothetical protein